MTNPRRYKFPKTVVFGITVAYVILMVATYYFYYKEPIIVCAQQMLVSQAVAFGFQIVLNYVNNRSNNKIVIFLTLFISSVLLFGAIIAFFNLGLMCKFYGF